MIIYFSVWIRDLILLLFRIKLAIELEISFYCQLKGFTLFACNLCFKQKPNEPQLWPYMTMLLARPSCQDESFSCQQQTISCQYTRWPYYIVLRIADCKRENDKLEWSLTGGDACPEFIAILPTITGLWSHNLKSISTSYISDRSALKFPSIIYEFLNKWRYFYEFWASLTENVSEIRYVSVISEVYCARKKACVNV